MKGWLSKKQLAEYIGVKSVRTVDRWVGKNKLPNGKKFPSGTFWKQDIVDRWLESFGTYEKECDRRLKHLLSLK